MRATVTSLQGEDFDRLSPAWRQLVSDGVYAAPFYQPEWFNAFGRAFMERQSPFAVTVWAGSALKGLAPLVKVDRFFGRVPARTIHSLSGIHSCRFDLIHDGHDAKEVADAVWGVLRDDGSWDVIEAEDVPNEGAFWELLRSARADGFLTGQWGTRKSPFLSIPREGADPFSQCPKSFKSLRSRLKSKLRRLEQEHGKVSFAVDEECSDGLFERFLALESSGWKRAEGGAITSNRSTVRFYTEVIEYLHRSRHVRFYSLRVGEKTIAMQMGCRMNGVYYSPKVAYDEAYAAFSPGHLLARFVIEDLAHNDVHTFDFLGPRALWKCVWAPRVREHSNCYIFRPSLKGRLLHALTMHGAAYVKRMRHRFRGDPQDAPWGQSG